MAIKAKTAAAGRPFSGSRSAGAAAGIWRRCAEGPGRGICWDATRSFGSS